MDVLSPFILSSVILTDSSTVDVDVVHRWMDNININLQAVRGLPRLREPGIVPCINLTLSRTNSKVLVTVMVRLMVKDQLKSKSEIEKTT